MAAEEVEEALKCPVCQDLLEDACETACGHAFCERCINEWLQTQTHCPLCRSPSALPVHPSFALRSLVRARHPERGRFVLRPASAADEKAAGNACVGRGEYARAIAHYGAALAAAADEGGDASKLVPALHANRALAYLHCHQPARALQDCDAAVAADGLYVKALLRKACCHEALGDVAAARAALARASDADRAKGSQFSAEVVEIASRLGMFQQQPPAAEMQQPPPPPYVPPPPQRHMPQPSPPPPQMRGRRFEQQAASVGCCTMQ